MDWVFEGGLVGSVGLGGGERVGNVVEMGSCWSEVVIGEEIVGVSLVWSFEVMVDGHCWVSFGVVVRGWVMSGDVGCCVVMCGVVGHFGKEVVVAVECWEEEEVEVKVD